MENQFAQMVVNELRNIAAELRRIRQALDTIKNK